MNRDTYGAAKRAMDLVSGVFLATALVVGFAWLLGYFL